MSIQTATTLSKEGILQLSDRLGEPDWLREKRLEAFNAYEQMQLPVWDRTSLSGLDLDAVSIASNAEVDLPAPLKAFEADRAEGGSYVIEVDHKTRAIRMSEQLKEDGVVVADFATAIKEHEELLKQYFGTVIPYDEDKLVALHYAALSSGLFVYVPKNTVVEQPIEYRVHGGTPGLGLFPHVLIVAGENAEVTVIEGVSSDDDGKQRVISEIVEIVPHDGARVRFGSVQTYGESTWQSTLRRANVAKDGRVDWVSGDFGSRLSRSHVKSVLQGEGAESANYSVFFGTDNQHLDVGITMMHIGEHTSSDMLTKGVLDDESRVVYRGLTDIENGACFSSGFQNENTMLLSKTARSDAIPGLEIDETEVQAGHAATTGQIDPLDLFYLEARGIPKEEAIKLIVMGFFDPVISGMDDENLKAEITQLIDGKMRK